MCIFWPWAARSRPSAPHTARSATSREVGVCCATGNGCAPPSPPSAPPLLACVLDPLPGGWQPAGGVRGFVSWPHMVAARAQDGGSVTVEPALVLWTLVNEFPPGAGALLWGRAGARMHRKIGVVPAQMGLIRPTASPLEGGVQAMREDELDAVGGTATAAMLHSVVVRGSEAEWRWIADQLASLGSGVPGEQLKRAQAAISTVLRVCYGDSPEQAECSTRPLASWRPEEWEAVRTRRAWARRLVVCYGGERGAPVHVGGWVALLLRRSQLTGIAAHVRLNVDSMTILGVLCDDTRVHF